MDQSSIKQVLVEPLLKYKAQDEIAVGAIQFLYTNDDHILSHAQFVSCHADGYIRIWDIATGTIEQEINLENIESESMTCMVTTVDSKWTIVGGKFINDFI